MIDREPGSAFKGKKVSFVSSKTGGPLGAFMVLGWVLYDLAVFGMSKEPYLAVRLLPGSTIAVMLGYLK
jgi:hypothetical protein